MSNKFFIGSAWSIMTLLALAIAGYAIGMVATADLRPPYMRTLIAERPFSAILHFLAGGVALAVGAFQFNSAVRARVVAVHRWTGRVYVCAVLASGLAGLSLAVQSNAGLVAQSGFGLLALAWLYTTSRAWQHIRHGEVAAHRDWMTRSYALTLAAVTLRVYLPGSQMAGFSMAVAYPAIAWLCWVPNLMVAEMMIRGRLAGGRRAVVA